MKRERAERTKIQIRLQQLQAVLADQRDKVASLQDYRMQSKDYTAEIQRLEICAGIVKTEITEVLPTYGVFAVFRTQNFPKF